MRGRTADIVLRAYAAKTPGTHRGRAIRLAAGPHRWWLALDRQARPFGLKPFSIPDGPLRLFPAIHPR